MAEFQARHLDLVKLVILLLGDPGAAEDVVHDVFTQVWERRQRLAAALDPEPGASAKDVVPRADEDRLVLRALAALPRRQREALILRYYQRLSEAEIAEVMGISRGTVKSTAARGLAALGKHLRQEGL